MKTSNSFRVLSLCALLSLGTAYDIRCVYPTQWTQNLFSALGFGGFFNSFMRSNSVETPVVVRASHWSTVCRGMCLSLHDPDVLDPILKQPTWTVPEFGQNGYATVMCIGQCIVDVMDGFYDFSDLAIAQFIVDFGLEYTKASTRPEITNAWELIRADQNEEPMMEIMAANDYDPYTMGHIAGIYVRYFADRDGWNSMGLDTYDRAEDEVVPCTGNCRVFQTTIGYQPVPDPRKHSFYNNDDTKYECTGNCVRWQPLQEGTEGGSLKIQEFVTPHIGVKAKTVLRNSTLTLENPNYDLRQESLAVIETLGETTQSMYKKDAIEFFDDKLRVRGLITVSLRKHYSQFLGIHSFQDEILSLLGISTAEYDGVVQSWHEKLEHDLVRPTTVIKHWGDDVLMTYGGDATVDGPVEIKARDFEAFTRVMPHPEFPSGSSCLCTAYFEFTDKYLSETYGTTLENLEWAAGGRVYTLANMEHLRDECGASRLWGGMHYPAAITAGNDVCTGLGDLAYEYVTELKNGATFAGGYGDGPWYYDDILGDCPNDDE